MLKRHNLLFFNRSSIDEIIRSVQCVMPDAPQKCWSELVEQIGTRIPGIVRRQESKRAGYVDVGFSTPQRVGGVRYRVSASVPLCDIERVITPFEMMHIALGNDKAPNRQILSEIHDNGCRLSLSTGLLGSQALQAITGLHYASQSSDYDLIVEGEAESLQAFSCLTDCVEQRYRISTDVEVRVQHEGMECDVKMKDYLAPSIWVMGKTITEVLLFRH